jgi:hypothetical protein
LRLYPDLSKFLWKIGDDGIDDSNFDYVMNHLPSEFKKLVHDNVVYNSEVLSKNNFYSIFPDFGYHKKTFVKSSVALFQLYKIALGGIDVLYKLRKRRNLN